MASTATTAKFSRLRIETAESTSTLTISGISKAATGVVSYASTGTDLTAGDIVTIESVVGMTEVNNRAYVVGTVVASSDTFELRGIDTTGYTSYTSGGTVTPKTMSLIGNIRSFDITPDEAEDIDVTNLESTRQEYRVGLPGSWTMSCEYDIDPTDTGQAELLQGMDDGVDRVFTLTLSSGKVFAGIGYVKSMPAAGAPNSVVRGTLRIRGTGQPAWWV